MIRIFLGILFSAMILCPVSSQAEGKQKSKKMRSVAPAPTETKPAKRLSQRMEAWIKHLKRKTASAQTRQHRLVAVAAVRGNEVKDAPPLYWKTKPISSFVSAEELDAFKQALSFVENEDATAAKVHLEGFLTRYPNSTLKPDIEKTLAYLTEAPEK